MVSRLSAAIMSIIAATDHDKPPSMRLGPVYLTGVGGARIFFALGVGLFKLFIVNYDKILKLSCVGCFFKNNSVIIHKINGVGVRLTLLFSLFLSFALLIAFEISIASTQLVLSYRYCLQGLYLIRKKKKVKCYLGVDHVK